MIKDKRQYLAAIEKIRALQKGLFLPSKPAVPDEATHALQGQTEDLIREIRAEIAEYEARFWQERKGRGDIAKALEILWAAGDEPPREGDEVVL